MTTYGDSTYAIAISTTVTDNAPSGDIHYILAKSVELGLSNEGRQSILVGGQTRQSTTGKRNYPVEITDIQILKASGVTLSTAFSNFKTFVTANQANGAAAVYLFVKNTYDNIYMDIGTSTTGTAVKYIKGYITKCSIKMEGNMITGRLLTFTEGSLNS